MAQSHLGSSSRVPQICATITPQGWDCPSWGTSLHAPISLVGCTKPLTVAPHHSADLGTIFWCHRAAGSVLGSCQSPAR